MNYMALSLKFNSVIFKICINYQAGSTVIWWDFFTFGVIPICSNFKAYFRWLKIQKEITISGVYMKTGYFWIIIRFNRFNFTHSDGSGVFLRLFHFCCCWSCLLTLFSFHKISIIFSWQPLHFVSLLLSFFRISNLIALTRSFYARSHFYFQVCLIILCLDRDYWWYLPFSFYNQYSRHRRHQILQDLNSSYG